jgi:hypothetical protein
MIYDTVLRVMHGSSYVQDQKMAVRGLISTFWRKSAYNVLGIMISKSLLRAIMYSIESMEEFICGYHG